MGTFYSLIIYYHLFKIVFLKDIVNAPIYDKYPTDNNMSPKSDLILFDNLIDSSFHLFFSPAKPLVNSKALFNLISQS